MTAIIPACNIRMYYKSDTVTPRVRTNTSIEDVTNEQSIDRET